MQRRSRELVYGILAVCIVTLLYLLVSRRMGSIPVAGSLFGHSLGVLGFLLMLMTETLYSLRKRSRSARWGRTEGWLQFHIVTGMVGPYMVLLHTAYRFNGLAGVVTLLMALVVGSGFVGRYIYTAIPRTVDGTEMGADELERQIAIAEAELGQWQDEHPEASRTQAKEMERLRNQHRVLRRQVTSLAAARRTLAIWHSVHVPLGMALFVAAFIHIGAAIYYATLLK